MMDKTVSTYPKRFTFSSRKHKRDLKTIWESCISYSCRRSSNSDCKLFKVAATCICLCFKSSSTTHPYYNVHKYIEKEFRNFGSYLPIRQWAIHLYNKIKSSWHKLCQMSQTIDCHIWQRLSVRSEVTTLKKAHGSLLNMYQTM